MNVIRAFNNHLSEFIDDVLTIFPDDRALKTAKTAIETLRKMNPKQVIMIWKEYIEKPYGDKIQQGDLSFFLNKDYSLDVTNISDANNVLKHIERLREPVRNMGKENQEKAMKYLQNLTKLSSMFEG